MTYKLNPFTGKLDTSDGPQGPAGVVSAAGPGSQGTPSISFAADLDTGLYNYTPNGIAVSTGGTGRLFVDANGNVGVGVSPGVTLDVNGQSRFNNDLLLADATATRGRLYGDSSGIVVRAETGLSARFHIGSAERLRITSTGTLMHIGAGSSTTPAVQFNGSAPVNSLVMDSSGRVGLGTSSPVDAFSVGNKINLATGATYSTAGANYNSIFIGNTTSYTEFVSNGSSNGAYGGFDFIRRKGDSSDPVTALRIDTSGNVGIGATSVSDKLHIGGGNISLSYADGSTGIRNKISWRTESPFFDETAYIAVDRTGVSLAPADIVLATGGAGTATEKARITSDGKLGVGTSSPGSYDFDGPTVLAVANTAGSSTLAVVSDAASFGHIAFADGTSSTARYSGLLKYDHSTDSLEIRTAAAPAVTIDSSQRVGIGTTSPASGRALTLNDASNYHGLELQVNGTGIGSLIQEATGNLYLSTLTSPGTLIFRSANQVEAARITSSGQLLVGTSTARSNLITGSISSQLQVEGTSYDNSSLLLTCNSSSTSGAFSVLSFAKSGTSSIGSNTLVGSGHYLGSIAFTGNDGTKFVPGAYIEAIVDGTSGADDMPTRLVFSTTAASASSPTERMRITSDAYVRLASGTGGIQFNGDTAAANALDDYEEGIWTPTVEGSSTAGTATYQQQSASYTKIGNVVYYTFLAAWTGGTGTGNLRISGLPFNASSASNSGSMYLNDISLAANNYGTNCYADQGSVVFVQGPIGGGSVSQVGYDAAGSVWGAGFYYV
jgi:hypothetical protein